MEDDIYCHVVVDGRVIGDATDFKMAVLARFASYYTLKIQYHEVVAVRLDFNQIQVQVIHR